MRSATVLAAQARRLNLEAGAPPIPSLYFFTDPDRVPDPVAAAKRLPRGTAVVFRHFGVLGRARTARRLASLCRSRGLILLIAADPDLAKRIGAHGVHWPEHRLPDRRDSWGLATASAHGPEGVCRAARFGADACVLGPVFPTRSISGRKHIGLFRASQLARAAGMPVIALGGINPETARRLCGRGFAGVAAVEALTDA